MITPQKLLEDFTKDIVANPGSRPELIAGYASTLQSRDDAIRRETLMFALDACGGQNIWIKERLAELEAIHAKPDPRP
jgi:hypothetical protein